MLEGLMALCALPGISGHEGPVRAYLKEALSPLGLEVFTDPMGNLYAHRPGPGPRVMVAAHMDEVGMVVRGHREDGTLAYAAAGIDCRVMPGKRVWVGLGPHALPGVIGCKAIHLQTDEEFKKRIPHEALYLDIGAGSREEAMAKAPVGAPVWFQSAPMVLGDLVCSKALDLSLIHISEPTRRS